MQAVIVTIGNELLSGDTVDTNSVFLAGELAALGIPVVARYSVPDEAADIVWAVRRGLEVADLVLTTGGLGPTRDDITLETIAAALGEELVVDPEQARRVREIFSQRGLRMPLLNENQFLKMAGATIIYNPAGTAPGQLVKTNDGTVCLLPGVPVEVKELWRVELRKLVKGLLPTQRQRQKLTLRTAWMSESIIAERLDNAGLTKQLDEAGIALAFLPHHGTVDLRLTRFLMDGQSGDDFAILQREIEQTLGSCLFGYDSETLGSVVGRQLTRLGLTLGTAESCTGGLIGKRLTDAAGSSGFYLGGVIAYSNDVKMQGLGVPAEVLEQHGAVSRETAAAMARGALEKLNCDIAISVTGIAGPSGGSDDKPVGTVYLGLAQRRESFASWSNSRGAALRELSRVEDHSQPDGDYVITRHLPLFGNRWLVRHRAAVAALDTLRLRLRD